MIVQTAERIRELREKNDMTQSELAKRPINYTLQCKRVGNVPFYPIQQNPSKTLQGASHYLRLSSGNG